MFINLEGGGSVDPKQPCFGPPGILPAVGRGTFEIETIAGTKAVVPLMLQPDFKLAAKHVKKFLALVRIGFTTATARLDAKQMRLHGGIAPSEKLHTHFGVGFENFAVGGTNEGRGIAIGVDKGDDVGFVETGDAAQRGDRRAHLSTLERAKKADRNGSGASDLSERKAALDAKTAETLTGRLPRVRGSEGESLLFKNVHDRSRIQTTRAPKKNGALQQADIGLCVEAITAFGAARRYETKRFPRAQCRRRDAETASHLRDAQETAGR
jgi:hypothetical protein